MHNHITYNVIKWNRRQAEIAERDFSNPDLKVPKSATVRARYSIKNAPWERLEVRPMTQAEYRASRQRDYIRHTANVRVLENHI